MPQMSGLARPTGFRAFVGLQRPLVAKGKLKMIFVRNAFVLVPALLLAGTAAFAQQAPKNILPPAVTPAPAPLPAPALPPADAAAPAEAPLAPTWSLADAGKLLGIVRTVAKRGLIVADYEPDALQAAITGGEGVALNDVATRVFTRLATDLRDGRTPRAARVQWLIVDSDAVTLPIDAALTKALASHDIDGALTALEPKHPDYAALKAELAKTPASDTAKIGLLRVNLERWRWMPQMLGEKHVLANVP